MPPRLLPSPWIPHGSVVSADGVEISEPIEELRSWSVAALKKEILRIKSDISLVHVLEKDELVTFLASLRQRDLGGKGDEGGGPDALESHVMK